LQRSIAFNFSHVFDGIIWNIKVSDKKEIMVVEVRDSKKKEVRFSALNYNQNKFLWKEKAMDESWWINLSAVSDDIVLFTLYTDTNNPDKKATLAYGLDDGNMIWWNNDFSISTVNQGLVVGFSEKYGKRELVLDLKTGKTLQYPPENSNVPEKAIRPQQYMNDHSYFETVQRFFTQKFNLLPVAALEYLEHESLIFISCYFQENELANYLFVLSVDGTLLLKEQIDEHLKGIGLDTFFILSGSVFFVKNKVELVSYKIL
jgi:hypothetical protein